LKLQTITNLKTASNNIVVTSVECYDEAKLKGAESTSSYSFHWMFTASDNAAHIWTARAYDAAGNVSTSSPITLTISIDITPPTVTISSPINGANLATATTTVLGTATDSTSPSSGVSLVEVRVNGGVWQTASGTSSWNRNV